jgi:hypothetical protein
MRVCDDSRKNLTIPERDSDPAASVLVVDPELATSATLPPRPLHDHRLGTRQVGQDKPSRAEDFLPVGASSGGASVLTSLPRYDEKGGGADYRAAGYFGRSRRPAFVTSKPCRMTARDSRLRQIRIAEVIIVIEPSSWSAFRERRSS